MLDKLQVGAVTSTHGLAGEIKVYPTTDDPARFRKLKTVLLETKQGMREMEIERVKFFKNLVILKFRGLNRIEDVEGFRGCSLYVTRENAVELEEGEYFIADLIGMKVYADEPVPEKDGRISSDRVEDAAFVLGELTDVLQTGANDVYEVTLSDGRQVLIPAIRQCILDVNTADNTMRVHLLEGLLE
ncbi:MAG: ribosome maturation factor RimM [Lachnospiraceae bacterium]|nr:ribosome maturation factor RimM [Lachnospiraceae bacterium]